MKAVVGVIPLWDDVKESIWMLPGYMDALKMAGALPIILPLDVDSHDDITQLCEMCDGFLFTGGHDVNPALYKQHRSDKCGLANSMRDKLEARVFDYALENDIPILGICRGIQLINVLCGGTLYQDLPSEYYDLYAVNHQMSPPYDKYSHRVKLLNDTPLYDLLQCSEMEVNSYHHQAIKDLAPNLEPMAVSEDGLIEAIFMPNKRFIQAVQWHPEFNYYCDKNSQKLIVAFVESIVKKEE